LETPSLPRLLLIPLLALPLLLAGCGAYFVGFVSNPGNPIQVTGTVVKVQLGFYDNRHGTSGTFTAVTLMNAGVASTMNFCGNQQQLFPLNQSVQVQFNTGIYCYPLLAVTVQS
jgi:hypothetical protein